MLAPLAWGGTQTVLRWRSPITYTSPLAQGRGSKRVIVLRRRHEDGRRPSRRGVDRNRRTGKNEYLATRRPPRRAWIETQEAAGAERGRQGAPRAGAWIETRRAAISRRSPRGAPRAGAWIETFAKICNHFRRSGRPSRRGVDRNAYFAAIPGQQG